MADPGQVRSLPGGRVTFLLSDIEGSTRLFHRWGSAYAPLLDAHRRLLREAVSGHGGVEVDTEGDAVLSAFPEASAAVGAALDGQLALAGHAWPEGGEIRVRMGVQTGEAEPRDGGYVSLAVHQVARICAAAHGGQVVLSQATAAEVGDRLPPGADLLPLGSFQLRGFPAPERLHQLRHPALPADFPDLRAAGAVPHNLPRPRTSLVGRDAELQALLGLLRSTGVVTVVGPGGVGKTRLALQVALDALPELADGAFLVEFAPLLDPALVPHTVAAVLRAPEHPDRPIEDLLVDALAERELLLVLDNCEHLLDSVAGLVDHLTAHCPQLTVLATSREPLDVDGEVVWRLAPLPTSGDGAAPSEAARLFADRAALARPGFALTPGTTADVERLVARLDGLPLAVELAAAAMADRPLTDVLAGLSDRFALLDRGRRSAPARHRTLRAALEWSLDLLQPAELIVLTRLSVFSGGGTTEPAVAVCSASPVGADAVPAALRRLVRASLLLLDEDGRWSMPESVRDLAGQELASAGDAEATAARHRAWFADRAEQLEPAIGRSDRPEVMREVGQDLDNLRRALDSAAATGDADTALRLAAAVAPFWTSAGRWSEGADRLARVLALPGGAPAHRGRALAAAGQLALLRGELDAAGELFAEAAPLAADDVTAARVLSGTGYVAFRRSRLGDAERDWTEALARARAGGDQRVAAGILRSLAVAAGSHQDQVRAEALLAEAVAAAREAHDGQLLRQSLGSSAEVALWRGKYWQAAGLYGEALDEASAIGDLSARPLLLAELGWVALLRGDVRLADRLAVEASELAEDLGNLRVLAHAQRLRGEALLRLGEPADEALGRALAVAEEYGAPAETAGVLCSMAVVAWETNRLDDAAGPLERARSLPALLHPMRTVSLAWASGAVALARGDLAEAGRRFTRDIRPDERLVAVRWVANSHWGLGWAAALAGRAGAAVDDHLRGLRLRARIGDVLGIADSLVGLATAVAARSPVEAARLVGAAEGVRARAGAVATPRQAAEVARVPLDPDLADARAEGRSEEGLLTEEGVTALADRLLADD